MFPHARLPLAMLVSLSVFFGTGCGPGMVSDEGDDTSDALSASCNTLLKPASISASGAQDGNPASHAFDGNLSTRWSSYGKGQSLTASFSASQSTCAVQVAWYRGTTRKNHFVVSVSSDGKTFTPVVSEDSSGTTEALETYSFSAASARYVRVTVNGNTANDWASITEVKVVGATASSTSGKPGPSNTGVPAGTQLTKLVGDQVINAAWMSAHPTGVPAGAGAGVMQDQDIYGTVHVEVPNFTLRRSRVRGKQTPPALNDFAPLVFVSVGSAAKDQRASVIIEDNELAPTYPSPGGVDGLFGWNFTARRNNIHHTIDGMGLEFYTDIEGNWVHDLTYFDHDSGHTNGTHNDCAQLHNITNGPVNGHGGENKIVGNFFSAFIAQDAGTPSTQAQVQQAVLGQGFNHQAMSAIMINSNFKNTVTDNWFEGGYAPVNGLDPNNVGTDLGTYERNVFDGMRYDNPGKYFGISSLGSFDVTPRMTFAFRKDVTVQTGAATSNANKFETHPTTPGIVGGSEVLVRFE